MLLKLLFTNRSSIIKQLTIMKLPNLLNDMEWLCSELQKLLFGFSELLLISKGCRYRSNQDSVQGTM